jgi:hypothetical protein
MKWLGRISTLGCLVTLVAFLGATPAGAQTELSQMMAVDAAGNEIGQVVRVDSSLDRMQVAYEAQNSLVFIVVQKESFTHGLSPLVFFESADCTGAAYMTLPRDETFGRAAAVAGPNGTLYLGDPDSLQNRVLASALWSDSCRPLEVEMDVIGATPHQDLGLQFTPPYTVIRYSPTFGHTLGTGERDFNVRRTELPRQDR